MDKRKKYICVVDTEALGVEKPLIYDLGITIADKKGNIYHQANWIIEEIFSQKDKMQSAYYACKLPKYYEMLENGQAQLVPWLQMKKELIEILNKYHVKVISAYNLGFDRGAIAYTHTELGNKNKFLDKPYEMWDIWGMATQTLLRQRTYHKIANRENWKTPKGNLLTNAEVTYRYITNQLGFIEDHTALSDTTIETAILARCIRQRKKMFKGILEHPWRIAQQPI